MSSMWLLVALAATCLVQGHGANQFDDASSAVGAAAVQAALKQSHVTGSSGDAANTPLNGRQVAAGLKDYLNNLFANDTDRLQKIRQAWQQEEKETGFAGPWQYVQVPQADVTAFDSSSSQPFPPSSSQAQGGTGRRAPSCPRCEAINALYETQLFARGHASRMEDLVTQRGYPLERHTVVTPDGYELVMFRIPHGVQRHTKPGKRPVVMLYHGVSLASDCFVMFGRNESLGFALADAGFDVWFGNSRGNTYSRRNIQGLYPYQLEFWQFSMDQLAQVDLPTQVDYVLQTTGASKLGYVGHSQGGALALALCAAKPQYNQKFSVLANLAPVWFSQYLQVQFVVTSSNLWIDSMSRSTPDGHQLPLKLPVGELFPARFTAPLVGPLCSSSSPISLSNLCGAAIAFFAFGPTQYPTPADFDEILRVWPSSIGSLNSVQWAQNLRRADNELRYYDYGTACNLTTWHPLHSTTPKPFFESCNQDQYGADIPPAYDLRKVTAPVVTFAGGKDLLSTAPDLQLQQERLGAAWKQRFTYPTYSHMDFIWSRSLLEGPDVVDVLNRFSPGTY